MAKLNKTPLQIRAKRGTEAQITATPAPYQLEGEIAYATDTKQFYISNGTKFLRVITTDTNGDVYLKSDNDKIFLGTAKDVEQYYNGTDFVIDTGAINPGDLIIDCGTEKTLELTEVVWDDLRTPANNAKAVPGKEAKDQAYKGGVVFKFEDNKDQAVAFNVQLPHKYKEGEDIEFHLHLVYPTATAGNTRWIFTYSWANIGDTHPAETTVTTIIASPNEIDNHQLAEIAATIDGTGKTVSSMLICSVTREGTDGTDTLGQDVYLTELDFHYPIDTIGSRQEASK